MKRRKLPIDYVPIGSRLRFIKISGNNGSNKIGLYKCSCGSTKNILIGNVKSGKQLSCGCYFKEVQAKLKTTHGLSNTALFKVWTWMRTRCYNKNSTAYKYYGAIGVVICDEWKEDFKSFYDWAMTKGWEHGKEIDKDLIPKRLGIPALIYSPAMCCIITRKENCNARKSNHLVTFNGVTKNVTQWEEDLGFNKEIILNRLRVGWSIERALTQPPRKSPTKRKQ